ncbi:MAG: hypothetical protein JWO90_380 [Solirubrobacterales bacterium]|nr:hypothetical protein [Solirubrobacterales bacterium]
MPAARRIVFVHESPDGLGGSQTSMRVEAQALLSAGFEVLLVHGQCAGLTARTREVFAVEHRAPGLFGARPSRAMLSELRALGRFLEVERADAVHLHLWSGPLLLAYLARRLPLFATCHVPVCPNGARFQYGTRKLCERAVGGGCLSQGYRRLGCGSTANEVAYGLPGFVLGLAETAWTLRLLARCDGVVAPSHWQRRMLVGDGIAEHRITVIPPAIPVRRAPPAPPAGGVPVVLAAGRLTVLKGFEDLLHASSRIAVSHEVQLAGEGPSEPGLRALAERLGISDRVHFLGALSQAELAAAAAAAAVVAVPSVWPETFGMVGPEALLTGTPVVAYRSGGIADWATPEHGAVAVAPGDIAALARELTAVLEDPPSRRLSAPQHAAVDGLVAPSRHAATLVALYDAALRA